MKKIVLTALALATVAASPALAATQKHPMHRAAVQNSAFASESYATRDPYAVVENGTVIGRDPDLFIRSQIERDHGLQGD